MNRVYGCSDDLVEIEGEIRDEICHTAEDSGVLLVFSDGTILTIAYGKGGAGIWGIAIVQQGSLFDRIEVCTDEDAEIYSDQVFFKDGLKWVYSATEWERHKRIKS